MTKITDLSSDTSADSIIQDYVKFSKRMLKTQLFMGTFQEKRFVEPLRSYRDLIRIDPNEDKFIENLLAVKKKIKDVHSNNSIWIGITEPDMVGAPVGYNLWVELPIEIFGKYWFKVKTVRFYDNEVCLKLDIVRPVKTEHLSASSDNEAKIEFTLNTNEIKRSLREFYNTYITYTNIRESVFFVCLLISSIIIGTANIAQYLMEYLLKLIRECSMLIKVSTPIILTLINTTAKVIFGLCSLIVSLFVDKPKPEVPVYNSFYLDSGMMLNKPFSNYGNRKALQYINRNSGARITPLD